MVTVSALDGWLPVGSEGTELDECPNSTIQLQVTDDFTTPVMSNHYLIDPFDGATLQTFQLQTPHHHTTPTRLHSPTGRWYSTYCNGNLTYLPEAGPATTITALIQQAINTINPQPPPQATNPTTNHITNIQTWLAIEPTYWHKPRTATATAGRVTVTATLTPTHTTWNTGDNNTTTCHGPGLTWRPGLHDHQSPCHHTYTTSTHNHPNQTTNLTTTIHFTITHTTNAPGTYGPYTPITRTTTQPITINEIQTTATPPN